MGTRLSEIIDEIAVAQQIIAAIAAIEKGRKSLDSAADRKANAIAEYDKAIAITMVQLKMGEGVEIDGKVVKDPPVGMMEKLAKGYCWLQCLEREAADAHYKGLVTNLECLQAQLNGWQSVNRHLDITPETA